MAVQTFVPASWPRKGGKIIFPAPKKRANNISPTARICFDVSVLFSIYILLNR
jgi:hypothetical protein